MQKKDRPTRLTPLMMAGGIASAFPLLEEQDKETLDRLFSTPESTEATLRHLAHGPNSDHLPSLRELRNIGGPISQGTTTIIDNFTAAAGRLEQADIDKLGVLLADKERVHKALRQAAKAAKSKA